MYRARHADEIEFAVVTLASNPYLFALQFCKSRCACASYAEELLPLDMLISCKDVKDDLE